MSRIFDFHFVDAWRDSAPTGRAGAGNTVVSFPADRYDRRNAAYDIADYDMDDFLECVADAQEYQEARRGEEARRRGEDESATDYLDRIGVRLWTFREEDRVLSFRDRLADLVFRDFSPKFVGLWKTGETPEAHAGNTVVTFRGQNYAYDVPPDRMAVFLEWKACHWDFIGAEKRGVYESARKYMERCGAQIWTFATQESAELKDGGNDV